MANKLNIVCVKKSSLFKFTGTGTISGGTESDLRVYVFGACKLVVYYTINVDNQKIFEI